MRTPIRKMARDDRGATIVEFALVAPVLILVLVACLDFARGVNAYVTVANASREGARFATVHPTAALAEIKAAVTTRMSPLDTSSPPLSVDAFYDDGTGPLSWPNTGGIPQSAGRPAVSVRVVVTYQWAAVTAIVGSFFGSSGPTFSSASSMEAIR